MIAALLALLSGCAVRTTDANEVGVKVSLFTGMDADVYPAGGTYFMSAFTDWYTFSTQAQTLTMVAAADAGDRAGKDDLEFKTRDGNDVGVDVTIIYRLDPAQAPRVLQSVAADDESLKEFIVRPMARSIVRDVLNTLSSEDIYAGKKFSAAEDARKALDAALSAYGLHCDNVILGDHRFHETYQKAINDRKEYDQQVNTLKSAADNIQREWEAKLESKKGEVERQIAQANGKAQQEMLDADAYYVARQKEAEADLAERTAKAQGVRELNKAMAGAGGRVMVKRKIAEALAGKKIVVLPGGSNAVGIQKLDVNDLIKAYAAKEAGGNGTSP
jgi:regulator of protease activity HflC (stomatin/prohibitin superfamily)